MAPQYNQFAVHKITNFQKFTMSFGDLPEFTFDLVKVPPGLHEQSEVRDFYDDRGMHVGADHGSIWIRGFNLHDKDHAILQATFGASGNSVQCDNIFIDQAFQKQGIGTALYDYAGEFFGKPVEPSTNLSPAARIFWSKRKRQPQKGGPLNVTLCAIMP